MSSFDDFLARRFRESRRKGYYLMSIHEHLPPQARKDLKEVGWTKGLDWRRSRAGTGSTSIVQRGFFRWIKQHLRLKSFSAPTTTQ